MLNKRTVRAPCHWESFFCWNDHIDIGAVFLWWLFLETRALLFLFLEMRGCLNLPCTGSRRIQTGFPSGQDCTDREINAVDSEFQAGAVDERHGLSWIGALAFFWNVFFLIHSHQHLVILGEQRWSIVSASCVGRETSDLSTSGCCS